MDARGSRGGEGARASLSDVRVTVEGRSFRARLGRPTGSGGGYPVIAFGHGFAQRAWRYDSTLHALAARGYIVVAPDSGTGPFPSHRRLAEDLWCAIRWARATQRGAHPTLAALSGHSMGGGAALLAAGRHGDAGSVATLAAMDTRPSALEACRGLGCPTLFVVGSLDRIVPAAWTRRLFDAMPEPATWASVTGGYHCGFIDSSTLRGLGCDSGSIPRSRQLDLVATLLGDWFDETLKGRGPQPAPQGVTVERR